MSKPCLSVAQVTGFLKERYGSSVPPVERLEGGEWSAAFGFGDRVVRFGEYAENYENDRRAGEIPALAAPPVEAIGAAFGVHFCVSERRYGQMLDELDAAEMRRAVPAVLRMLAAIRERRGQGYGPWPHPAFASWRDYLLSVAHDAPDRPVHGWRARLERMGAAPFDAAYAVLREAATEPPDGPRLIHGDLLYRNVLVQGGEIAAVLDWGNALLGDGLYDLAWFAYWSAWYPAMDGLDWVELGRVDTPNYDRRMRALQIYVGLDAMQYNAFTGQEEHLRWNARRTLALAGVTSVG